jgi:hypothetical protein
MLEKFLIPSLMFTSLMLLAQPSAAFGLNDLKAKFNNATTQTVEPAPAASSIAATTPPANTPTDSKASAGSVIAKFSNSDQVGGLRQELTQAAEVAVSGLAKQNGFLGNDKVRIPLPENLHKAEGLLRKFGMGKYADDLTTSMNRAAEAAVPEAKNLLVGAIKKMSIADARNIITGPADAATQFFRTSTKSALTGKFQPIVIKSMHRVKFADKYDQFASKGVELGLVDKRDANLESYITRKTLDGLFLMMAEQEKIIRANPLQATGNLAKQIFSAINF